MVMFKILTIAAVAIAGASAFTPRIQPKSVVLSTGSSSKILPRFATLTPPSKEDKKALLENLELPDKLYVPQQKELPKVLGGLKIGLRELVVVTGASSGLGLNCAATLAKSGKYFVVMACRDVEKAKRGK